MMRWRAGHGEETRKLELRQLSYFVEVAEELHFGRAAAKVRQSQAPDRDPYLHLEVIKEG